jgi:hypothetical protein
MSPKIVKHNGQNYFQCQWTGQLLTNAYGIPKKNGTDREGSFADAACAIAHLRKQFETLDKEGKPLISDKSYNEKLAAVHQDLKLHVSKQKLVFAPEFDDLSKVNFSYREECPWMYQPRLHTSIESIPPPSSERKSKSKKLCVLIVPVEGGVSQQLLERGSSVEFSDSFQIRKIASGSQKSKDLIVLSSQDGEDNLRLNSLFPPKEGEVPTLFKGDGIVICKVGDESVDLFTPSPDKGRKTSKKSKEQTNQELEEIVNESKKRRLQ